MQSHGNHQQKFQDGISIEVNLDYFFQRAILAFECLTQSNISTKSNLVNSFDEESEMIFNQQIKIINDILTNPSFRHTQRIPVFDHINENTIICALSVIEKLASTNIQIDYHKNLLQLLYSQFTGIPTTINNGGDLSNVNFYEYLRNFSVINPDDYDFDLLDKENNALADVFNMTQYKYDPGYPYGDLYTQFLLNIESIINTGNGKNVFINKIINLIYYNFNLAMYRSYNAVKQTLHDVNQTSNNCEKAIRDQLDIKNNRQINTMRGRDQDGHWVKFKDKIYASYVRPQTKSMPSFRHFQYQSNTDPDEIRIGTQGIFTDSMAGINPLFLAFLENKNVLGAKKCKHVYINLLPHDRLAKLSIGSLNTQTETKLTHALHEIDEARYGIAMITLPSSQGLLDRKRASSEYTKVFNDMLDVVCGRSQLQIQDMQLSDTVKTWLYHDNGYNEEIVLSHLLHKSFKTFGFKEGDILSGEDQQKVYFHFIKYEFTRFITDTLKVSFNISCWDGMDRAGIASLYYNLNRCIEENKPFSLSEFECAMHGPAVMIKEKSINNQIHIFWSVLNTLISKQDEIILNNKRNQTNDRFLVIPEWLRQWCLDNSLKDTLESMKKMGSKASANLYKALLNTVELPIQYYDKHTGFRGFFTNITEGENLDLIELRKMYKKINEHSDFTLDNLYNHLCEIQSIIKHKKSACPDRKPLSLLDKSFNLLIDKIHEFELQLREHAPVIYKAFATQNVLSRQFSKSPSFKIITAIANNLDDKDIECLRLTKK